MSADDGGSDVEDDDAIVISDPPPKPPPNVIKLSRLDRVKAKGFSGTQILEAAVAPIDWVWEPTIVAGTTVTIGGPPTSGKSTLLFQLLAARANPEPISVLGRPVKPAPHGQYIVIVEEQNGQGASRKILRAVTQLGLDPEKIAERIILLARAPVVVGDLVWKDVVGLVGEGLVSDIAVDTLANTTKEDANDEQQQIILYRQFRAALNAAPREIESKPVLWIVGHTRKGEDSDVTAKDFAGHHQRVAQTDTLMMLEAIRGPDGMQVAARLHFTKERDNLDGHSAPIRFDRYGQICEKFSKAPPEIKMKDFRTRVLSAIGRDPKHTVTSLCKLLQCGHTTLEAELAKLVAEGRLEESKVRRRGGTAATFRIPVPTH